MKSKTTAKKVREKNTPPTTVEEDSNENLRKEEIKEIVEETVEEVLKEQLEKEQESVPQEEKSVVVSPDVSLEPTEEKVSQEAESTQEASSEGVDPMTHDISQNESVSPQENKQELQSSSTPIVSASPLPNSQTVGIPGNDLTPPKKSSTLRLFIFFLIFGIVVGGAILWYVSSHNMFNFHTLKFTTTSTVSPTKALSPTLTLTPKTINISTYKVTVLNGSGVAGAAAKAKTILTNSGFSVENTGNAATNNFTQTVISAKSTVEVDALVKLTHVLENNYTVSAQTLLLDSSQSADIVVTIGSSTK